jgi:hypothetical protein
MIVYVWPESDKPVRILLGPLSSLTDIQRFELREKLEKWLNTWIGQWMYEITHDFTDNQVACLVKGKLYDIALGKEPTGVRYLTTEMLRKTEVKVHRVIQEMKERNRASEKIHPLKAVERADFAADQEILLDKFRQQQDFE